MLLSDKYPFLTNYFQTAINNKLNNSGIPITHSILLYGRDLNSQYVLAKEIARLLNCKGDYSDNCQCLNCKWIREEQHPAVMTISRIDNKPVDDETKTVISIKQSEMIKNALVTTSEFYRVFIFCDKDDNGDIKGLTPINFQEETANSMLKIIEEPNDRVLFIFLTSNKEDIISTIISRSQCFAVSGGERESLSYDSILNVFENYWDIERKEAFDVAQKLLECSKTIPAKKILEDIQNYILMTLKVNPTNTYLINDIKQVELAKKQLDLGMSPQNIFESMCLKLIK